MTSRVPYDETPSTHDENVLLDRALDLHPSPEDIIIANVGTDPREETEPTETTSLLEELGRGSRGRKRAARSRSASSRRKTVWFRRPHPFWVMPIALFTGLFLGAQTAVELEILTRVACRAVELETYSPVLPLPPATYHPAMDVLDTTDEEWAHRCRKSTLVAKKATSMYTTIVLVSGIVSAATAGWFGSLSDRIGRKPVISIGLISVMIDKIGTILVATYPERFGILTYIGFNTLASFLGGSMCLSAVIYAYVSDSTPAGSRANIFARFDAMGYAGAAMGPIGGALLIRAFGGFILAPYYLALAFQALFILLLATVVPESLSLSRRRDEKLRGVATAEAARIQAIHDAREDRERGRLHRVFLQLGRKAFAPFAPLAVLAPRSAEDLAGEDEEHRPRLPRTGLKPGHMDWNLTATALCYASIMIVPGIGGVKLLFSRYVFNWGTEEVGTYITFVAITKLVFLLGIFPLVIKKLRNPAPVPERPRPTSDIGDETEALNALSDEQRQWDAEASHLKLVHDSHFDLSLARWSITFAIIAYTTCGTPSTSPVFFIIGTALISGTAAALPALQSLALSLASPRDSGRLLASLSVISSLSIQVLGTPFFGAIYVATVDWLPQFVMFAAAGWFALALVPAMGVRLPRAKDEVERV